MDYALDLNRRHFTKTRGDITAIGTWLRLDQQWKPCMVLIPADTDYDDRLVPCVVTQDSAWMWSREVGDPASTVPLTRNFSQCLRFPDDPRTLIKIASFIEDMLGDLLRIPPFPQSEKSVVAEALVYDNNTGEVLAEHAVME
jgi:hypothetical protein